MKFLYVKTFIAFVCGLIFAAGIVLAGLADPNTIIGFLDIFGEWRPILAVALGASIVVLMPVIFLVQKKKSPVFDAQFHLPLFMHIDRNLIVGAVIFGLGWGLAGFCPGGLIVALGTGAPDLFLFLGFMIFGMWIQTKYPLLEYLKKQFGSEPNSTPSVHSQGK